jgi:hypothetical protein
MMITDIILIALAAILTFLALRARHLASYARHSSTGKTEEGKADASANGVLTAYARSLVLSDAESFVLAKANQGLYNEWNDHKDLCPVCLSRMTEEMSEYFVRFKPRNGKQLYASWEKHTPKEGKCSLCGKSFLPVRGSEAFMQGMEYALGNGDGE